MINLGEHKCVMMSHSSDSPLRNLFEFAPTTTQLSLHEGAIPLLTHPHEPWRSRQVLAGVVWGQLSLLRTEVKDLLVRWGGRRRAVSRKESIQRKGERVTHPSRLCVVGAGAQQYSSQCAGGDEVPDVRIPLGPYIQPSSMGILPLPSLFTLQTTGVQPLPSRFSTSSCPSSPVRLHHVKGCHGHLA